MPKLSRKKKDRQRRALANNPINPQNELKINANNINGVKNSETISEISSLATTVTTTEPTIEEISESMMNPVSIDEVKEEIKYPKQKLNGCYQRKYLSGAQSSKCGCEVHINKCLDDLYICNKPAHIQWIVNNV